MKLVFLYIMLLYVVQLEDLVVHLRFFTFFFGYIYLPGKGSFKFLLHSRCYVFVYFYFFWLFMFDFYQSASELNVFSDTLKTFFVY